MPRVLDWTGSIVVGLVAVLDSIGTGTMGFGVLNSDGSDVADSETLLVLVAADETATCEGIENEVFADEIGMAVLLGGNSVRLRLAVALASVLGLSSVKMGNGEKTEGTKVSDAVATFESVEIGTTGGNIGDSETTVDDCSGVCSVTCEPLKADTGVVEGFGELNSVFTDSGTLRIDDTELRGVLSTTTGFDEVPSGDTVELANGVLTAVVLVIGVLTAGVLIVGVFTAGMLSVGVPIAGVLSVGVFTAGVLTVDVGITTGVETGTKLSSTDENGVSEGKAGKVLLTTLEGRAEESVVLSTIGVVEGRCLCLTV